ncbi:hypothetical protein QTO02_05970 [Vibrio fortis]
MGYDPHYIKNNPMNPRNLSSGNIVPTKRKVNPHRNVQKENEELEKLERELAERVKNPM